MHLYLVGLTLLRSEYGEEAWRSPPVAIEGETVICWERQRALPRSDRERDAGGCLLRKAVRGADRVIEDQAENDGAKKEGVPGREGGLGRSQKPSLSAERSWSRIL